ncbi:MAG: FAD-dependent oxidoreductase [Candidatus Jordarchaeales archaeon]
MFDVLVVGGGVSGLSVGAILSRKGIKTLVVERASILGGRGKCFEYREGYIVDYGVHALRMADKGAAANIFRQLGEKLEIVEPKESGLYHEGDWSELPLSINAITSSPIFTKEDLDELISKLGSVLSAKPEDYWSVPLSKWMEENIKSKRVKWFIQEILSKLLLIAVDASETSSGELFDIIQAFVRSGKGAGFAVGGWKSIIDRLREIVEENGKVYTKRKVEKILVENGEVKGAIVSGEKVDVKIVVAAFPVQSLFNLVEEKWFSQGFIAKAKAMKPTMGISIDYGLTTKACEYDTFLCSDPWIYGAATSNIDATLAPQGEQLLTVFSVLRPEVVLDKERAKMEIERIEKKLEEMFPKIKGNIKWRRPIIHRVVDGAALTVTQSRDKRPGPETSIKGLYLTGDTCNGHGAGGDIAYNSAVKCADVILRAL